MLSTSVKGSLIVVLHFLLHLNIRESQSRLYVKMVRYRLLQGNNSHESGVSPRFLVREGQVRGLCRVDRNSLAEGEYCGEVIANAAVDDQNMVDVDSCRRHYSIAAYSLHHAALVGRGAGAGVGYGCGVGIASPLGPLRPTAPKICEDGARAYPVDGAAQKTTAASGHGYCKFGRSLFVVGWQ